MTPAAASGAEFRRFEFKRCLGVGGFGEVYLARMTTGNGLSRDVAVKLLLQSVDPSSTLRLRDEARLLAALNHRAILQIYDLIQLEGRAALVTEFVDGVDLSGIVAETGPLHPKLALELVGEVAGALNAALTTPAPDSGEPLGLVHRDIKPGNIRVARSGAVKLLDFGIAVSSKVEREAKTGTGVIVGTMGYLAPERITEVGVFPPSDVYALGCVLYEAIVGERLYAGVSQSQTLRVALHPDKHDEFLGKQLDRLEAGAGPEVRGIVSRALAYEAAERFSASELEHACEELSGNLPGANLRRWAREREWVEPAGVAGSLDGRTIETVATLGGQTPRITGENVRPPSAPMPAPRRPAARPAWVLPVAVLLAGVVAAGVAGTVVVGAFALSGSGESKPAAASAPPVVTAPVAPAAAPVAKPAAPAPAAAAVKPAAKAPAPRAEPVAKPAPVAKEPVATGTVNVSGGVSVQLRSAAGNFSAGAVPAGSYEVWADFGSGPVSAGSATVAAGGTVTVKCSAMMLTCKSG